MQRHRKLTARPGIAKLWLILLLPCIIIALCLVIEIANLWIARAELENAMEAAALAAVKDWGDANTPTNTQPARAVGVEYARTNSVRGEEVVITENRDAGDTNENDLCEGNLLFGAITSEPSDAPNHVFNADVEPNCNVAPPLRDPPAVRAFARMTVPSISASLFGANVGSFRIQAEATAFYDCDTNRPSLIRAETICAP